MEFIKMILKKLFAGQKWRNKYREQTYGHDAEGEVGCMQRVTWKHTVCKKDSQWEVAV